MLARLIRYFLDLFYPFFKKAFPFELYSYLAVGGMNTALNILLFAVLYQLVFAGQSIIILQFTIMSYTASLLIAFFSTVPTGFWLARHITFKQYAKGNTISGVQLGKYILVVSSGLISDYLVLKGFVTAGTHPTLAKIMSTSIVLTLSFLLQKYFTFRAGQDHKNENHNATKYPYNSM